MKRNKLFGIFNIVDILLILIVIIVGIVGGRMLLGGRGAAESGRGYKDLFLCGDGGRSDCGNGEFPRCGRQCL